MALREGGLQRIGSATALPGHGVGPGQGGHPATDLCPVPLRAVLVGQQHRAALRIGAGGEP